MRLFEIASSKSKIPDLDSYNYGTDYKRPGDIFHKAGITLYHGTSIKNALKILKTGLQPRAAKHEEKIYHELRLRHGLENAVLPPGIKAIYTARDIREAQSWMQPVIFAFVTNNQDTLAGPQYNDAETLVLNKITPDRLKIVSGADLLYQKS